MAIEVEHVVESGALETGRNDAGWRDRGAEKPGTTVETTDTAPGVQGELDHAVSAEGKNPDTLPEYRDRAEKKEKGRWTPEMQKAFDKAIQRRIGRYDRKNHELRERAEATERELAELKTGKANDQEPQRAQPPTELRPAPVADQPNDEVQESEEFQTRVDAAKSKYGDYEQVVLAADKAGVQVPHDFGQALKKLPNGPDVVYLLAKHPNLVGEVMSKLKGLPDAEHEIVATQLAQEISHGLQNAQRPQTAQRQPASPPKEFSERVEVLKKERGIKMLDAHAAINIPLDPLYAAHNGPEIVAHLLENLSEAEQISKMPFHRAVLEVGRLSARLEGQSASRREAPKTRVGLPPRLVGGSANMGTFDPYKDEITDHAQYKKWRKGQGRSN